MAEERLTIDWGPWLPLEGCWLGQTTPDRPGLYRIRRAGRADLDYVGQTGMGGMNLRRRLGMLRGVYAAQMPYRDPHTAAPALWALRQADGAPFEVSVTLVEGSTAWRKGLETLAIALHRQEHGRSPTVEFGRVPLGYQASTGNNKKLVVAGKRSRGGPSEDPDPGHMPGVPPVGPLGGDPQGLSWGGHAWSPWRPIADASRATEDAFGLYRIRGQAGDGLLYIGEGRIGTRLRAHAAKIRQPAHRQGGVFVAASALEASWVVGAWATHQRLEARGRSDRRPPAGDGPSAPGAVSRVSRQGE
ncbi:GIY-YIG nuclease family protein [Nannocystis pusilla]|uniref:GIY-YIG nuclease family protein n=1 Tax=Nannocystis pusilla TaxID=889268 RepID=UPI003DA21F35